jgi:hypothetical protein
MCITDQVDKPNSSKLNSSETKLPYNLFGRRCQLIVAAASVALNQQIKNIAGSQSDEIEKSIVIPTRYNRDNTLVVSAKNLLLLLDPGYVAPVYNHDETLTLTSGHVQKRSIKKLSVQRPMNDWRFF